MLQVKISRNLVKILGNYVCLISTTFYAQFDSGFSPRQPETEILLKHEKYIKFENFKKRLFVLVGNATNSWLKCRGN